MKKAYSKPEIMFENFSLSTNIAAGCEHTTSLPSYEASCAYISSGFGEKIFVSAPNCEVTAPNGEYGNICYHNPSYENNLFNS